MEKPPDNQSIDTEGTPFRGRFNYIKPGRVAELPGMENKVVREEPLGGRNLDEVIELFNKTKEFLTDFSRKYNILMPGFDFVVGKDEEGQNSMFTVVDKIEGMSLDLIEHLPAEALPRLDQLYESLLQAEFDAYRNTTPVMWDDNIFNFTYGHRFGEKENRPYLHDIEPFAVLFPDNPKGQNHHYKTFINDFRESIKVLTDNLKEIECKFLGKVRLQRARKKAAEILNYLRKNKES